MAAANRNDHSAKKPTAAVGVTSGVSISETWIQVFERNETADEKDRLTDAQISELMKREFPDLDAITFDRIEIARGKYNRGGFHKKDAQGRVVPPKLRSHQHGSDSGGSAPTRSPSKNKSDRLADRIVAHKRDFKSHKK